jgi:pyruvate dehydrogenase E2 component (dihydrolipoamide acetyltransferase)
MPSLGAEMEAGRLVEWRVKPGDRVKRGDIVAVVDTDKASVEVEIWESGVLEEIRVKPGERVPVGTVLATLRSEADAFASAVGAAPGPSLKPSVEEVLPVPAGRARVSPAARRRAMELGVNLDRLKGFGPEGAITSADVERSVTKPLEKTAGMRSAIAAAMARSKREIPHYYLSAQIDMGRALEWLKAENAKRPLSERILSPVLLFKGVAKALERVPELNGYWIDGRFKQSSSIHLGIAISLRSGLVAPALHDVNQKSLPELMKELNDLVTRARSGSLKSSELSDATLTITNLGDQGVESVFGVIYPPQVALVGFGRITQLPWVVSESIVARPILRATLSADHRASDGHRGAVFLSAIDRIIQEPGAL